jgi:hypothetical protein
MATLFKSLWKNDNPKNFTEIFSFNEKKFKIHVAHHNGDALGFNSNCALYVMLPDGTFSGIIDSRQGGIKYSNLYYSGDLNKIKSVNDNAVKSFKDFVKKVYA